MESSAEQGEPIYVPTISLVEVLYLVEKGRLPEEAWILLKDAIASHESAFRAQTLDEETVDAMKRVPRTLVPDMPDRIIAATALKLELLLITRDRKIQFKGLETIW